MRGLTQRKSTGRPHWIPDDIASFPMATEARDCIADSPSRPASRIRATIGEHGEFRARNHQFSFG